MDKELTDKFIYIENELDRLKKQITNIGFIESQVLKNQQIFQEAYLVGHNKNQEEHISFLDELMEIANSLKTLTQNLIPVFEDFNRRKELEGKANINKSKELH